MNAIIEVTMRYDPSLSVRQALVQFYCENGFSPEDSQKNFYRIQLGPFTGYVSNPGSRKKVVHLHDIEHILYEIEPDLAGEAELSAISLACYGCKPWVNYFYSLAGILTGMVIDRQRTLRGFAKGLRRRSVFDLANQEDILDLPLGELRQRLGIFVQ